MSIGQPLVEPLYPDARSVAQVLDTLLSALPARPSSYDLHREHWRGQRASDAGSDFERWWRRAVHDGFVAGSAAPALNVAAGHGPHHGVRLRSALAVARPRPADTPELVFTPDPTVWDGRFANNPWLQETPKPISKLTWDNAALVSPALARAPRRGERGRGRTHHRGRPQHPSAPRCGSSPGRRRTPSRSPLGYGRDGAGRVGDGQGVNAYRLRTTAAMGFAPGLGIKKVPGARWTLAVTQQHHALEGRAVYRAGTLAEFRRRPDFPRRDGGRAAPRTTRFTRPTTPIRVTPGEWSLT